MKDATPLLNFEDSGQFMASDSDQMLFELDDVSYNQDCHSIHYPWDFGEPDNDVKPLFPFGEPHLLPPNYDYHFSQSSPTDSYFDSGFYTPENSIDSPSFDNNLFLSNWMDDRDQELKQPSSPIPIPSPSADSQVNFVPYLEPSHFPQDGGFSPAEYAALHPLPASASPASSFEDRFSIQRQRVDSISPQDTSLAVPDWATQLWDTPRSVHSSSSPRAISRPSPLSEGTQRLRISSKRGSSQMFQSASAPSFSPLSSSGASAIRPYSSRRVESASEDRDATVRRKRKTSVPDEVRISDKASESGKQFLIRSFRQVGT